MLTKPEDNDKRRILAGDRSGVLPKTMELSAEKLMALLKQTQPQKPAGEQSKPAEASKNGNGVSADKPAVPAKAGSELVKQVANRSALEQGHLQARRAGGLGQGCTETHVDG